MTDISEPGDQGLTRRELLRKGALLGGALAWSIPTIQTFRMAPAFAAATSYAISYVAVVLKCGENYYQAKYDVGGSWSEGGALPCSSTTQQSWPEGYSYSSGVLNAVTLPSPSGSADGSLTFDFNSSGCEVIWSLSKCAQICQSGPTGSRVTFEACQNPV